MIYMRGGGGRNGENCAEQEIQVTGPTPIRGNPVLEKGKRPCTLIFREERGQWEHNKKGRGGCGKDLMGGTMWVYGERVVAERVTRYPPRKKGKEGPKKAIHPSLRGKWALPVGGEKEKKSPNKQGKGGLFAFHHRKEPR